MVKTQVQNLTIGDVLEPTKAVVMGVYRSSTTGKSRVDVQYPGKPVQSVEWGKTTAVSIAERHFCAACSNEIGKGERWCSDRCYRDDNFDYNDYEDD